MLTQREEELQYDLTHTLGAPLASGSRTKGGKGGSGVGSWVIIKIIQDRDEIFMGVLKIDQGTCFIVVITLLQWSRTEPTLTVSSRFACNSFL